MGVVEGVVEEGIVVGEEVRNRSAGVKNKGTSYLTILHLDNISGMMDDI